MSQPFHYRPFGILRFVLALLVLTQHFCGDIAPNAIRQAVFPWAPGNVAVLGFFIMSGFIICEAYYFNYQGRPVAYLKNRFMRIVPSYWAALAVSILIHFIILQHYGHLMSLGRHAIGPQHFGVTNIIRNAFAIVPHVSLDVTDTHYIFIPYAWALQTEMMFYVTVFGVGFAYPLLQRFSKWPHSYWLAVAGYMGLIAGIFVQIGWLPPNKFAYGAYFAFGGSLFYVLHGYRKALFVLVPAFLEMLWHFHSCDAADFVDMEPNRAGQLLLLTVFLIAFVSLAAARVKQVKVDKWFGEFSYPLYLNHYVIAVVILNTVDHFSVEYLFFGLLASLILTVIMFWLVDKPLIKLRRSIRQQGTKKRSMVSGDI